MKRLLDEEDTWDLQQAAHQVTLDTFSLGAYDAKCALARGWVGHGTTLPTAPVIATWLAVGGRRRKLLYFGGRSA